MGSGRATVNSEVVPIRHQSSAQPWQTIAIGFSRLIRLQRFRSDYPAIKADAERNHSNIFLTTGSGHLVGDR
ncbi:MAG: hypothetical protein ACRDHZ_14900, partial [Ktedonobacteraceae bacterium]